MAYKRPQEMVQTDSSTRSSSPFWRNRPVPTRNGSGKITGSKVVGASYSHADLQKFEQLSVGSSSRPQTPPVSSSARASPTPSEKSRRDYMSPERNFRGNLASSSISDQNEQSFQSKNGQYSYFHDDEDEFGLPSIAHSQNRRVKNNRLSMISYPSLNPERTSSTPNLTYATMPSHMRSNSFDIAEERNTLSYPSTSRSGSKILRPQYKEVLLDPANSLHLIRHPTLPSDANAKQVEINNTRVSRINKFKRILQTSTVNTSELQAAAWSGIPEEVRAVTWQILLGYLPANGEERAATLERKRREYLDGVKQAFGNGSTASQNGVNSGLAGLASNPPVTTGKGRGLDEALWHQIVIDVPRTNPTLPLYQFEATQRSLERILYVWALRHPASGYVQGINDLATPFWQVFLAMYITSSDVERGMDPGQLPKAVLDAVEADTFWCLTKLLEGIQDSYIVAQPGIHRQVAALRDLTARIDGRLAKHFEAEEVEYMQFSFRWMNCLLMREFSVRTVIRMWDTYMAEEDGFSQFHLYVCAAFLVKWSDQLMKMNFQEILMFLQALPTKDWTEKDIELLLSEAFIWQSLFRGSKAHLRASSSSSINFQGSLGPPG